jgi:hypothetical protein
MMKFNKVEIAFNHFSLDHVNKIYFNCTVLANLTPRKFKNTLKLAKMVETYFIREYRKYASSWASQKYFKFFLRYTWATT